MPPKRVPVYTPGGQPTSTTVRVRNGPDSVVYKRDRPKLPQVRPAPSQVPKGHRFKDRTPARSKK